MHGSSGGDDPIKGARVLAELHAAGVEAAFMVADLGEERQAADLVGAIVARFSRIDVVVNNAGAGTRRSDVVAEDGPGLRLRKLMRANLDAAYHVAAHALPVLHAGGGGSIVNISSPRPPARQLGHLRHCQGRRGGADAGAGGPGRAASHPRQRRLSRLDCDRGDHRA